MENRSANKFLRIQLNFSEYFPAHGREKEKGKNQERFKMHVYCIHILKCLKGKNCVRCDKNSDEESYLKCMYDENMNTWPRKLGIAINNVYSIRGFPPDY